MSILFEPISIGKMTVKNRFVRSATNDSLGTPDGGITDRELDIYRELAANEVGLIITGHSYVQHPLGRASANQNAIYHDRFIEGYAKIAGIAREYGARLVIQVSHAGRQVRPDLARDMVPVAPSAVTENKTGITPRELSDEEIFGWIDNFAAAMARARAAGCDGVQLHIAHGYGLSQFLSPHTNRRTDRWGGSIENRTRILREIMLKGRRLAGDDFPVLVKLNSTDGFDGPGYLSPEDVIYTAKLLESLGVAAIEVSGGTREAGGSMSRTNILRPDQEAYYAGAARAIKSAVSIPVILVGGLRSLEVMESVVESGTADMVALSRPLVREPDLVAKFKSGRSRAASCVSCSACFSPKGLACYNKTKSRR
ncbi:MAG: NADH:flavin oxidoreductase [Bacillota bacterium]